jgi:hypothetical protein
MVPRQLVGQVQPAQNDVVHRAAGEDYLSDYRLGPSRPVRLRLDVLYNFGADDRRSGGEARVDWGEVQGLGSWRLRLLLQRVEQDAALAAFGGDEWWFRTRQRGARLGWALGLGRRASVEFSVLRQKRDDSTTGSIAAGSISASRSE